MKIQGILFCLAVPNLLCSSSCCPYFFERLCQRNTQTAIDSRRIPMYSNPVNGYNTSLSFFFHRNFAFKLLFHIKWKMHIAIILVNCSNNSRFLSRIMVKLTFIADELENVD